MEAISQEGRRLPSSILKNNEKNRYDIYVVHVTRKVIFYLYDDRSCDVIAADKEKIRFLYKNYQDWILDYDRGTTKRLFKTQCLEKERKR